MVTREMMDDRAKRLKAAAYGTRLPAKDDTVHVRVGTMQIRYRGEKLVEFGDAELCVYGTYPLEFALEVAHDLVARIDCSVKLLINGTGRITIRAWTCHGKFISITDPYTVTSRGEATITDIPVA